MSIDFNQSPFYDDFDAQKNFYRLLFRPNYAVQARELTQIQSLLQNQVAAFGRHLFKDGSPVTGGQTVIEVTNVFALNVEPTYKTVAIDLASFKGKFITSVAGNVRAYVAATVDATNTAPPCLIIKYVTGEEFDNTTFGQTLTTDTGNFSANVNLASAVSNTSICSINDGYFFINNLFAHCPEQTIVLDAHANTPSYRIGLQLDETVITESQDSSLRDPALNSSNYQAPGATRYNLSLTLAKRSLTSQDDSLFVELVRVANGALIKAITYPQLSDLERTLARRTNDQSGSFTVKQFRLNLGNDSTYANAYSVLLDPGKAYVQGFEHETISTTTLRNERARDVANVKSYPLSMDFKNYLYVANVRGSLYTKTLEPLTIHCVSNANINVLTTATAATTKIGTLRVRSVEHEDSVNTGIHTLYVFDVNVASRTAVCQAGGTSNTIILDAAAASQNNAYEGMHLRLGSTATQNLESVIISTYNGITKVATLEAGKTFANTPSTARTFTLDYVFADAESIVAGNSNAIWLNSDVYAPFSKFPLKADLYQGAYLYETHLNHSLFPLPNDWVGNNTVIGGVTMSNTSYTGRQTLSQVATAGVISFTTTAGIKSTVVGSPLSISDSFKNIRCVLTNVSGGTLGNNSLIIWDGSNTITVTSTATQSTYTITVPNSSGSTFDVDIKVNFPTADTTAGIRKSKIYRTANPTFFDVATPTITIATSVGYRSQNTGSGGLQLHFLTTGNLNSPITQKLRTPNAPQSLFVADVIKLQKVVDYGVLTVTNANLASATDITSSYVLDNGQRDNSYEHASIRLKPNGTPPKGNVVVFADFYNHTGTGYLTVDSYPTSNVNYADISVYTSPVTGEVFNLRDCIDFRPRRVDANTSGEYQETYFPTSGSIFTTDFSYYLPRIDKVILTRDKEFIVQKGISSITPMAPADSAEGMTLYKLTLPAYTANTSDIDIKYIDHRRYTMKDIGVLEQRIQNLEYYTSLNLLEKSAQATELQDNVGLPRPKNGIIVDAFSGHGIGDVLNKDHVCAIDAENRELRPSFIPRKYDLSFRTSSSTNFQQRGDIVTLPYTEVTLVDQSSISKAINVNPFNTVTFLGKIQLDPASDTWVDTSQQPDVLVNAEGDNDAWAALSDLVDNSPRFGTTWNSWQTNWTGVTHRTESQNWLQDTGRRIHHGRGVGVRPVTTTRFIDDITTNQVRTGIKTSLGPTLITSSLGNKVVDISIVPYMRSQGVLFTCGGFRPNTRVYVTFDNRNVDRFISLSNIIKVANASITYRDGYQHGEQVRVWDPANSRFTANATVVFNRNEGTYSNITVVNVESANSNAYATEVYVSGGSRFLLGNTSGANSQITGYWHRSGSVWLANANSIFIGHDALGSTNFGPSYANLTNQTITITSGPGAGQSIKFNHYNPTTGVISCGANAFSGTTGFALPNTQSTYTIGTSFTSVSGVANVSMLMTDWRGEAAGVFAIPDVTNLASVLKPNKLDYSFRTGERVFRISDSPTGELTQSYTNGDATYSASGILESRQNTILTTRTLGVIRQSLTESKVINSSVVTSSRTVRTGSAYFIDPLAQTFTVDARNHPNGVMTTSIRLLFRAKDSAIPVRVQLRPVVNGYPDSATVIPYADVVVPADKVTLATEAAIGARYANTSFTNPLSDSALYTEIKWDAPVYLSPGVDYAAVIITNSEKYEVFVSEVGKQLLGTNRLISQQPYLGSLFKSQNSSTWEPIQAEDLCFKLLIAEFSTGVTANVELGITTLGDRTANWRITSNVAVDAFHVMSSIFLPSNTVFDAVYLSTPASTGVIESPHTLQLDETTFFDDTVGRRVLTTNPDSFKVRMFFGSGHKDVSPIIDQERMSIITIENVVNNLGLINTSFVVIDSNSNFSPSNVSVTITPNANSLTVPTITANAFANVIANVLSSLTVDISGAGYTLTPTVTVTGGGPTASANVVCQGEDQSQGGPATARYITRKVTLADGMDAGDFRVYFSAYRPTNANIYVYYKVLSADDTDVFDDKPYQLMTAISGYSFFSLDQSDFKEFVFAPGDDNLPANIVQYGGYQTFKYFAIKLVMTSTDTTKVPRIRDFRVVAIPAIPSNG